MMSEVVATKQRIKSLLLFEGLDFPPAPAGSEWSLKVKAKLQKLNARMPYALSSTSCSTAWSFLKRKQ